MGKKKECPPGSPAWMTTFSDLNSLLMTMFVALFSMSTISPGKFQQVAMSFKNLFEGEPLGVLVGGKSMSEDPLITSNPGVKEDLLKIVEDEKFKGKITLEETDRGLMVSLKDIAFFNIGSAELTKEAKDILYKIGTIILEKTSNEVEIYGYTDDQKTTLDNIYPSNWHLAGARAASVASFFTGEMKNRRSLERIGDVKNGLFDINYFYNSLRFFPISAGDRDILQEIEYLNASNKSEKNILNSKFQNGEITAVELQKSINQLDQSYNNKVEELRNEYRRIDILILKERIR